MGSALNRHFSQERKRFRGGLVASAEPGTDDDEDVTGTYAY